MYRVNDIGFCEIFLFLSKNHKRFAFMVDDNIEAWCDSANEQMAQGNPPTIEVNRAMSISGIPVEFTVSSFGIDEVSIYD
jgi:hypothetical protein